MEKVPTRQLAEDALVLVRHLRAAEDSSFASTENESAYTVALHLLRDIVASMFAGPQFVQMEQAAQVIFMAMHNDLCIDEAMDRIIGRKA